MKHDFVMQKVNHQNNNNKKETTMEHELQQQMDELFTDEHEMHLSQDNLDYFNFGVEEL